MPCFNQTYKSAYLGARNFNQILTPHIYLKEKEHKKVAFLVID